MQLDSSNALPPALIVELLQTVPYQENTGHDLRTTAVGLKLLAAGYLEQVMYGTDLYIILYQIDLPLPFARSIISLQAYPEGSKTCRHGLHEYTLLNNTPAGRWGVVESYCMCPHCGYTPAEPLTARWWRQTCPRIYNAASTLLTRLSA